MFVEQGLLTAISRGLPFVLDIMGVRVGIDDLSKPFEAVHPELWKALIDKKTFHTKRDMWLAMAEEDEQYVKERFLDKELTERFSFILLTQCIIPSEKLTPRFMLVHIIHPPPLPPMGSSGEDLQSND